MAHQSPPPGGLRKDADRARRRAEQLAAIAPDWNPRLLGWTVDWQRCYVGPDRKPVEPSEAFAGQLQFLLTGAGSASASQMTAIVCGDVAERRGVGRYWRAVEESRGRFPLTGPLANNITPCEFWDRPAEAPTVLDNDVPALLVNATDDPRTLYAGAEGVRKQWPSSRLLTVESARQHGLYGEYGNACVDELVNAYLRTGQLPAHDLTCKT